MREVSYNSIKLFVSAIYRYSYTEQTQLKNKYAKSFRYNIEYRNNIVIIFILTDSNDFIRD